jgi:hypothetical protein
MHHFRKMMVVLVALLAALMLAGPVSTAGAADLPKTRCDDVGSVTVCFQLRLHLVSGTCAFDPKRIRVWVEEGADKTEDSKPALKNMWIGLSKVKSNDKVRSLYERHNQKVYKNAAGVVKGVWRTKGLDKVRTIQMSVTGTVAQDWARDPDFNLFTRQTIDAKADCSA